MDEQYDCVIMGTGLKECILSGLLSVAGKKVLHVDRNDYYGADSASLNLKQLFEKYSSTKDLSTFGKFRDWNIDLIPKFIMADGLLVKVLLHCRVTPYLEFKMVDGSFVAKEGKIHKVPATTGEALRSGLMGFFEKRRCQKFLEYVSNFDAKDQKTFKDYNPLRQTAQEIFDAFDLSPDTRSFIGHALALHRDDRFLQAPASEMFRRITLYVDSLLRFSNQTKGMVSPYIYPLYGLGELPQAFARLSAIYGGTYMLRKPVDEVIMEDGRVVGVRSEGEVARCKFVVGDPSYFRDQVRKTGQVVRCICLLNHPVADSDKAGSLQIIIPQSELKRRSDIYVTVIGEGHKVAPPGFYVAIIATTVETSDPKSEVRPAMALLGDIIDSFVSVVDTYEPVHNGASNGCFISSSYDATSHFETTVLDVLAMYKQITGTELDLSNPPPPAEDA